MQHPWQIRFHDALDVDAFVIATELRRGVNLDVVDSLAARLRVLSTAPTHVGHVQQESAAAAIDLGRHHVFNAPRQALAHGSRLLRDKLRVGQSLLWWCCVLH